MDQNNIQGMIQNGMFGSTGPMNQIQNGFNPYNNMVPFGGGYQQPPPQQYYYNQPQQNNNFVFQPVGGYQQQSPYGYYQQPQQSYYNPYGNTFNNNPYGNSYSYGTYGGYRPFISPLQIQQEKDRQVEVYKSRIRIAKQALGEVVDEEWLDRICNPKNPVNKIDEEHIKACEDAKFFRYVSGIADGTVQVPMSQTQREANIINNFYNKFHEMYDDHSLFTFLKDDLWRLNLNDWVEANTSPNYGRNLSATYDGAAYNQLLNLHNSTSNPYINQLLDNSRYDNNKDDIEIGMKMALDRERRRKAILEGKVPEFITSSEVQKRRHDWTKALMNQIYQKGSANNV